MSREYPEDHVRLRVANELLRVRQLGVSRRVLSELTPLGDAALWRAEQGNVHVAEVELIESAIQCVDEGGCALPARRLSAVDAVGRSACGAGSPSSPPHAPVRTNETTTSALQAAGFRAVGLDGPPGQRTTRRRS